MAISVQHVYVAKKTFLECESERVRFKRAAEQH